MWKADWGSFFLTWCSGKWWQVVSRFIHPPILPLFCLRNLLWVLTIVILNLSHSSQLTHPCPYLSLVIKKEYLISAPLSLPSNGTESFLRDMWGRSLSWSKEEGRSGNGVHNGRVMFYTSYVEVKEIRPRLLQSIRSKPLQREELASQKKSRIGRAGEKWHSILNRARSKLSYTR